MIFSVLLGFSEPLIILFIWLLFLAVLGLRCCMSFSLIAASRGYSLVEVHEHPIEVASLAVEHRFQGAWAQ